jgi:3-methyladenine DNA glycosylase AlkD
MDNEIEAVLKRLRAVARPDQLKGMSQFGVAIERRLGITIPILRKMAKEVGKNHDLALELWKTRIAEAMILASMIDNPKQLTEHQMDDWVLGFYSWDVCDQVCDNLFCKSSFAWAKAIEWAYREEEFVKRAAFALIAYIACHDKHATDEEFIRLLPIIAQQSIDERNFVKKAVNWALRGIGKRNLNLNQAAIKAAKDIHTLDSKTARWIASDAIRELEGEDVQKRLKI